MPHPSSSFGLITQSLGCSAIPKSYWPQFALPSVTTTCCVFLLLAVSDGGTELKTKCLKLTDMLDIPVEGSALAELQDQ